MVRPFLPPLGTLRFQTNFPALFLSASRLSRLCTNLADLMRPSQTTNSLLHSPSTSLHQARTACHTLSSKSLALGGVIFCFLSSTLCYGSLWFRPHGSPALSFRSSSEMVTPLLLILAAPFLASCAFKLFEHLIYARIAPHIPQLDPSQGGFCFGGRRHGFQPRKHLAPPPSRIQTLRSFWVEATLVRLFDLGVTGSLWHLLANFLCGTLSQARLGGSVSSPWVDSGIAQGRLLSPLLFNLPIGSLAVTLRSAILGVSLTTSDSFRHACPALC